MFSKLRGFLLIVAAAAFAQTSPDRSQLTLDTSEAQAVLAILHKEAAHQTIGDADWQRLFATEPYLRLKKREAGMKRDFTDDDFKKFVLSPESSARASDLQKTLETWKAADLHASAERVLLYLPPEAHIRARVFPVIKPKTNSFVFEAQTDPAIFLYLDPKESAAKFENTVAHELHHIGFSSVSAQNDAVLGKLPANVKPAAEWMSAFGEGFALLAAAGGPDVDPHAVSSAEERARWNHDMAHFNQDLEKLQTFFLDVINGKLKTKDQIDEVAYSFFGEQGPWYTVGYRIAVVIEKRYGRATLIDCMVDPGKLLSKYNQAAIELNKSSKEQLELWSLELVADMNPVKR